VGERGGRKTKEERAKNDAKQPRGRPLFGVGVPRTLKKKHGGGGKGRETTRPPNIRNEDW